jgi:uncharacterized protein
VEKWCGTEASLPNKVLRYAMSLSVATTICGVDSMEVLHQNLAVAVTFQPYSAAE